MVKKIHQKNSSKNSSKNFIKKIRQENSEIMQQEDGELRNIPQFHQRVEKKNKFVIGLKGFFSSRF